MVRHISAALAIGLVSAPLLEAQVPAGPEIVISTTASSPTVTTDAAGNFVVVYLTYGSDGDHSGVAARRFTSAGTSLGAGFHVNTFTTGCQGNADGKSIASDPAGNFTVVWMSFPCSSAPAQDGSGSGIFGQRYDALGRRRGTEFQINTYTTEDQDYPAVAIDAAGNAVVIWTSEGQNGPAIGVFGQRYDASGARAGREFRVDARTEESDRRAKVASDAAGDFVVVWERHRIDGVTLGIAGRRFAASGAPLATEFRIDEPGAGFSFAPSVAMGAQGSFVVVWSHADLPGRFDVHARRFDAAGTPLGTEFLVSALPSVGHASVTTDASGNFVVAWSSATQYPGKYDALARRFDASGAPRGPEFEIGARGGSHRKPVVSSDPSGNLVVVSDGRISIQRYGGLFPAPALADRTPVGSDGNGVLEAGETAEFAPSWRNANGAARTFSGQALGFSGPTATGVSYALYDGTAAYGTVADGIEVRCSDCYAVGVTSGGARPSLHWDAQLTEKLTPDRLGQTHVWPLHIGDSFADVPRTSPFYRYVETVLHKGVAGGCTSTDYCPRDPVTREQMAVFALVGKEGPTYLPPACAAPVFGDVPAASPYCRFIEELARRGVAGGCGGGDYCPAQPVTREQAAVFLLRTLDPALQPTACSPPNLFTDVPETSPFCRWIEEAARRGIAGGCGDGKYCPANPTTREQMAALTTQTFGLTLY
jgi:S-layer family protein